MSNLVNTTDSQRDAFLATCARHLAPGGVVLIERHEPNWRPKEEAPGCLGEAVVSLEDLSFEQQHVSGTLRYQLGDVSWRHAFRAHILDDGELAAVLAHAGLELVRTLDDAGRWVMAELNSRA